MWDTVRNQDFEALRALYHPDYSYTGPDGQKRKGADAGVAVARTYTSAFPDMSFEFRHKYACGEDVSIMEVTVRGTHQGELGVSPQQEGRSRVSSAT
jgi:hypothetical protein